MSLFLRLPQNTAGRDFVVGDIHGAFDKVEELLVMVGFDYKADRLVSVGDLVGRGPDSDQALDWLARPGFFAVMGNHELMALAHACGGEEEAAGHIINGGEWMAPMAADIKREYAEAFARMPLAIEIPTPRGAVGVVHADIAPGQSWQSLVSELEADSRESANWLLWSRQRFESAMIGDSTPDVAGIRRIYVGHTPVKEPLGVGNVSFIDTGLAFGGSLTLLNAHTGQIAARVSA